MAFEDEGVFDGVGNASELKVSQGGELIIGLTQHLGDYAITTTSNRPYIFRISWG